MMCMSESTKRNPSFMSPSSAWLEREALTSTLWPEKLSYFRKVYCRSTRHEAAAIVVSDVRGKFFT